MMKKRIGKDIIKNEDMKLLLQIKDEQTEKEVDDKRSGHRENPYFMKNRKGDDVTLLGILIAIDQ